MYSTKLLLVEFYRFQFIFGLFIRSVEVSVAALPTAPIIVNTQATGSYYPQSWAQATTPATFWRRVWRPNNCHLSHYRKILRQNFIKPITEDLIRCRIVALPRVATLINCARPDLLISIFISKSIFYSFSTSFLLWIQLLSHLHSTGKYYFNSDNSFIITRVVKNKRNILILCHF